MGVPPSSVNCLEAEGFLPFALGANVMRVPRPAAGMITTTFIAGCKYTGGGRGVQIETTAGAAPALPFLRRFPQLNAIAVGIHDPGEAAVIVIFAVGIDFHAFFLQHLQQRVQVIHAIVDHELGSAGIEVFRLPGKNGPHGHALLLRVLGVSPFKGRAGALGHALDTEVFLVPLVELLWIFRLEENAANACDASHKLSLPREFTVRAFCSFRELLARRNLWQFFWPRAVGSNSGCGINLRAALSIAQMASHLRNILGTCSTFARCSVGPRNTYKAGLGPVLEEL